jgi:nucleoid DNA-binding protein
MQDYPGQVTPSPKSPATSARKGRNPFTGEDIMIKAKPASRKVSVRALRTLNGMI